MERPERATLIRLRSEEKKEGLEEGAFVIFVEDGPRALAPYSEETSAEESARL